MILHMDVGHRLTMAVHPGITNGAELLHVQRQWARLLESQCREEQAWYWPRPFWHVPAQSYRVSIQSAQCTCSPIPVSLREGLRYDIGLI